MAGEKPGANFDLLYFFKGEGLKDWWKALGMGWRLLVIAISIITLLTGVRTVVGWFIKPQQNVNKPTVVVTPFAKVDKIDQTSTQISMTEKAWEAGIYFGGIRYDNKDGVMIGCSLKRKW